MKLSIVDLGTVAPGTTETESLTTTRHAEELGFHRVWFAEHHLSRSGASHHPELLIAAAAAQTSTIRLGSGAVLMNHYSPFKVAEMFQQIEAMAPGRMDLGMGRATAGPVLDLALQQNRQNPAQVDHGQQVLKTLAWLYEEFPEDHPFAGHPLMPSVPSRPQTWLLGSSPGGSELAAGLGIGYTFAGFINPVSAAGALRRYRETFRSRGFGLETPRAILAVNVAVGDTQADGLRLAASPKGFYSRLGRAGRRAGEVTVPTPEDAAAEMSPRSRGTDVDRGRPVAAFRRRRSGRGARDPGADGRRKRRRRADDPGPHRRSRRPPPLPRAAGAGLRSDGLTDGGFCPLQLHRIAWLRDRIN